MSREKIFSITMWSAKEPRERREANGIVDINFENIKAMFSHLSENQKRIVEWEINREFANKAAIAIGCSTDRVADMLNDLTHAPMTALGACRLLAPFNFRSCECGADVVKGLGECQKCGSIGDL